ncbi:MAG: hypothetical protein MZV70_53095 [Desulfobacterales bacterium]|nr:hypothetical protein [Desulfobacterales bacterium]
MNTKQFIEESKIRIIDAVKGAASARITRKKPVVEMVVPPEYSADVILPEVSSKSMLKTTEIVVSVGASTGGTDALQMFLQALPPDSPGIRGCTAYARARLPGHSASRLERCYARITVKEAEDGDSVTPWE